MGRRGPKPRDKYSKKSQVLTTRIEHDLRSKLETASRKKGHSLSQEIGYRLRLSFIREETAERDFGSRRNYLIAQLAFHTLQTTSNPENPSADWLDDPYAFDLACQKLSSVLAKMRPPGDGKLSNPALEIGHGWDPIIAAQNLVMEIQNADPTLNLKKNRDRALQMGAFKKELGDLLDRGAPAPRKPRVLQSKPYPDAPEPMKQPNRKNRQRGKP
jgi:hypothetical protein